MTKWPTSKPGVPPETDSPYHWLVFEGSEPCVWQWNDSSCKWLYDDNGSWVTPQFVAEQGWSYHSPCPRPHDMMSALIEAIKAIPMSIEGPKGHPDHDLAQAAFSGAEMMRNQCILAIKKAMSMPK